MTFDRAWLSSDIINSYTILNYHIESLLRVLCARIHRWTSRSNAVQDDCVVVNASYEQIVHKTTYIDGPYLSMRNLVLRPSIRNDVGSPMVFARGRLRAGVYKPSSWLRVAIRAQLHLIRTASPSSIKSLEVAVINKQKKLTANHLCCGKTKTYNRRDSQMVTHSSTSRPVQCLCMAERTGCPVFTDLWSYVIVAHAFNIIMLSDP
jgi:hypothetical protein